MRSLEGLSADDVYDDLVTTEAALGADAAAAELVPPVAALIDEWEVVTKTLRMSARKEAAAKAISTLRDAELDDVVIDFSDELLRAVGKDRSAPRFKRYFKQAPTRFVRIARLVEATTVQSWVPSIRTEPEKNLAAFAKPLHDASGASVSAINAAAAAAGERASERVRVWDAYVKHADAVRFGLHADLVKRGQEAQRPKDWADRFFKSVGRERTSAAGGASKAPTDEPAPDDG